MGSELGDVLERHTVDPVYNAIVRVEAPGFEWSAARGRVAVGINAPVRGDHGFRIASIAKTITAATLVRLAELGSLGLDDRVVDHADVAPLLRRIPRGDEITVRQALNHTAGLYDYAKDDVFAVTIATDPSKRWEPRELLDQSIDLQPPYFTPGEGCHYSDANYVLAGLVAEAAGGEPLHVLERRLVLDPLSMDHTWMEGVEDPRHEVAHAHFEDGDVMGVDTSYEWAAGGLISTAEDLTRLVRAVVGGRLFDTLAEDVLDRVPFDPGHHEEMRSYGLGVMECELAGATLLGHTGYWGTFMLLWPERDITVCGTVNQVGGRGVELVADLVRSFDRRI